MDEDALGRGLIAVAGLALAAVMIFALLVQVAVQVPSSPASITGSVVGAVFKPGCSTDLDSRKLIEGFGDDQIANARTIVQTGAELDVPPQGWVVALMTAIQESGLHNVDHGDRAGPNSRGLFQQRAAWGTTQQRMNPASAARLFFTGGAGRQPGLLDIKGWQTMPPGQAAQAVERSQYPEAYAEHEAQAQALVSAVDPKLGARSCSPAQGDAAVGPAMAFARAQLGQPYLWGGDGPANGENGFDCSGLVRAAYVAAGIDLPRTAQQQHARGPAVSLKLLQPGDLLFFGSSTRDVEHVGLYIGGTTMIDAPHPGAVVRLEDYRWTNLLGATRPSHQSH